MVDFFNRYRFNVVLSYDGPKEYSVRPEIASTENIKVWERIDRRGVTTCLTKLNPDYLETMLYLKKKFRTSDISIEMIYVNWNMPEEIYAFPKGYFERQLKRLLVYYTSNSLDKSFLTFTKNYLPGVIGRYTNVTVTTDGTLLDNRFNLKEAKAEDSRCHSCRKRSLCPFSGKELVTEADCRAGDDFYSAYLKHKDRLEALLKRDYSYLAQKEY